MRYRPMPSTVIRRWDYDEAEQRLDVTFVSGRVYSYHEVPAAVAQAMLEAFSKGSYFNRHIRDHFAFTEHRRRVSP
ncbi:KTSC domain-containing protein [Sphingomonas gei]|nr:KTSC domain-containing protein [Sphingomonas gei]